MKKNGKLTLARVREVTEAAAADWIAKNVKDEKDIRHRVMEELDAKFAEVVLKLMGFDNGWFGRWDVDHCNGRAGNSIVGEHIRKTAHAAAIAWIEKGMGNLPDFPKQAAAAARKEYVGVLREEVMRYARRKAEEDARAFVERAGGIFDGLDPDEDARDG